MASGVKPRRFKPSALTPRGTAELPLAITYGGTSLSTIEPPPSITCGPIRQNWWTAVKPPRMAKSPMLTCPASVTPLASTVSLPTSQSCATWT